MYEPSRQIEASMSDYNVTQARDPASDTTATRPSTAFRCAEAMYCRNRRSARIPPEFQLRMGNYCIPNRPGSGQRFLHLQQLAQVLVRSMEE